MSFIYNLQSFYVWSFKADVSLWLAFCVSHTHTHTHTEYVFKPSVFVAPHIQRSIVPPVIDKLYYN